MQITVHQFEGGTTLDALPLAAGLLVATARAHPALAGVARFEILTERRRPVDVVAGWRAPDVLAFSLYTWNARYSLEVARLGREAYPAALVVVGGPEVPRRAEAIGRFLRNHPQVDVLVLGEGEIAFRDLLRARLAGDPLEALPGLALRTGEERGVVVTPPRDRLQDFTECASPYLDGTFDGLLAGRERLPVGAILETNRGCPFSCTFCDWGQAIDSRVRELPLARVRAELAWIAARAIPYLYLADANFGIRPRDAEMARTIADLGATRGYPLHCSFHLTKNATDRNLATVEVLRSAGVGCHAALSAQDYDAGVLRAIRRSNIAPERSLALREAFNARGIRTFDELILGLPGQTVTTVASTLTTALTPWPGDLFFLYVCRVLENAELADPAYRLAHGLETRWCDAPPRAPGQDPFVVEREEVVVATRSLPPDAWRRAYRLGYLTAAAHDLRLLDVVLRGLRFALGLDVGGWLIALTEALETAPPGSVLGRVSLELDRFVASIRAGGPLILAVEGAGATRREPAEAVASAALAAPGPFIEEVLRHARAHFAATPSPERLAELFAFQGALLPGADRGRRQMVLEHDWTPLRTTGWRGGLPRRERVDVTFDLAPGIQAAPTHEALLEAWCAAAYTGVPAGELGVTSAEPS